MVTTRFTWLTAGWSSLAIAIVVSVCDTVLTPTLINIAVDEMVVMARIFSFLVRYLAVPTLVIGGIGIGLYAIFIHKEVKES